MIIIKTQTFPGMRNGYQCLGKLTTNEGVGTVTFTGKDVSAKITGVVLTPFVEDVAGTAYLAQVDTIAYSGGTNTITIYVQKLVSTAADDNVLSVTDVDIDVFFSFWVDDATLPTNQTTHNPGTENL